MNNCLLFVAVLLFLNPQRYRDPLLRVAEAALSPYEELRTKPPLSALVDDDVGSRRYMSCWKTTSFAVICVYGGQWSRRTARRTQLGMNATSTREVTNSTAWCPSTSSNPFSAHSYMFLSTDI
ncbi:unnamed protein product [Cyclocybe aegerita]|uniref:Secreted protein n=1 Tax=Cyclocybe aegerita TaxID=1973307 RepID=A0A8S0XP00_CYCAE|nr:unnamed protein product [Cyclocybe aegerita]